MRGSRRLRDLGRRVDALREQPDAADVPEALAGADWVPGRPPELTPAEKRALDEANDVNPDTLLEEGDH